MLGLPTLDLGIAELLPLPSLPSLLFSVPSLHPFPLRPHPINQLGGLGICELPQWGLGRSPSRQMIWCTSEPKGAALVEAVLCIFIRINLNFCTNTILLSSRYSMSLMAKHSVGSMGKAPGQGLVGGRSPLEADHADDICNLMHKFVKQV